jgi:putative ABC transport system substrate-binding protein
MENGAKGEPILRNRRRFMRAITAAFAGACLSPRLSFAKTRLPVIAFFRSSPEGPFSALVDAFRKGVAEEGLVEGKTVEIVYRWANNQLELLPDIAKELVDAGVSVIVGNSLAVEASREATSTIPIVFIAADDPVESGLVGNLARPRGNLTGITFFGGGQLAAKRIEILLELVPDAKRVALLTDPNYPGFEAARPSVEEAISRLGRELLTLEAGSVEAFDSAFEAMSTSGADALVIGGSPFLTSNRKALVRLAAARRIPAVYDQKSYVVDGGLVSYASSFTDAYRNAGIYAARIVAGAKPSELPVLQPTKFELAINLATAKSLGLEVPQSVLMRADEVVE